MLVILLLNLFDINDAISAVSYYIIAYGNIKCEKHVCRLFSSFLFNVVQCSPICKIYPSSLLAPTPVYFKPLSHYTKIVHRPTDVKRVVEAFCSGSVTE